MKNIATALGKAQQAFGPALKSSTNPHFRSRYADLSACVEAVIEGLNGAGIALVQRTSEDTTGVTVETVFIHESGEMLECGKLHVPAAKQDPQGYGSALTYARRYSLMAALHLKTTMAMQPPASRQHRLQTLPTTCWRLKPVPQVMSWPRSTNRHLRLARATRHCKPKSLQRRRHGLSEPNRRKQHEHTTTRSPAAG